MTPAALDRLGATVQTDVRLQQRNGFYYAVVFVLAIFALVLTQLPVYDWSLWLPALIFGNLVMVSFFFVAGLVLLEKAEGTLEAQVVTPLRVGEYLGSKLLTLAALSLGENLLIVVLVVELAMPEGSSFRVLPLVAGTLVAAVLYTFFGFITVARYDSINEFLLPATFVLTALSIPYLEYFDVWQSPLLYLHPLHGSLVLMKAAFFAVSPAALTWATASSLVWIALVYAASRRTFRRFVIRREGAH